MTYKTPCGRYEITVNAINPANFQFLNEQAQNGYAVLHVKDLTLEEKFNPLNLLDDFQEIYTATVYCDPEELS